MFLREVNKDLDLVGHVFNILKASKIHFANLLDYPVSKRGKSLRANVLKPQIGSDHSVALIVSVCLSVQNICKSSSMDYCTVAFHLFLLLRFAEKRQQ